MKLTVAQQTIGLGVALAALGLLANLTKTAQIAPSYAAPTPVTTAAKITGNKVAGNKMMGTTIASGNFMASEHPTAGQAMIVEENGQRYLEFSADFKSDAGPDLRVLLHRDQKPMNYSSDNYVDLGVLKNVKGKQRYLIPKTAQISDLKSAVIWCRQFNATFGFAMLTAN